MLRILFLFSLIIVSNNAQAQNPINECFADSKSDGQISVCLTIANVEIESVRKTIERELMDIIQEKQYVIPKHLREQKTTETKPGLSFKSPSGKNLNSPNDSKPKPAYSRGGGNNILEEALKKQVIQNNLLREKRVESDIIRYTAKKNERIEMHIETTAIFEQYRKLECNRLKEHFITPHTPLLSEYKYKICLYDMTKQRIESLQKSIEN